MIEEIIQYLEEGIGRYLEHSDTNRSKDFQEGFVAGLKQAIEVVKKWDMDDTP